MLRRFYLHSDKSEDDESLYYCAFCDLFVEESHFTEESHKGKHRERLEASKRSLSNLLKSRPLRYIRPKDAENLVELWPKVKKIRGGFFRWLMKQTERDDPIGDLAKDVVRDEGFPAHVDVLERAKLYMVGKNACSEAIQALDEAWSEFGTNKRTRGGIGLKVRFEIFRVCNYTCQVCGATAQSGAALEVDHKIPIAKGGTNAKVNLWVLCFNCNRGKGAGDL